MDLGFRVEQNVDGFVAFELMGDRQVPPADQEPAGLLPLLVTLVREEVQRTGISDGARVGSDFVDGKLEEEEPASPESAPGSVNFKDIVEVDDRDPDEELSTLEDDLNTDDEDIDDDAAIITEEADGQGILPGQERKVCQPLTDAALAYHAAKNDRVAATAKETATRDQLKLMATKYDEHFVQDPENSDSKIYVAGVTGNGKKIIVRDQKKYEEKITTEESE
jgi:hypothetical protein